MKRFFVELKWYYSVTAYKLGGIWEGIKLTFSKKARADYERLCLRYNID